MRLAELSLGLLSWWSVQLPDVESGRELQPESLACVTQADLFVALSPFTPKLIWARQQALWQESTTELHMDA